jgi:hypothetical protein
LASVQHLRCRFVTSLKVYIFFRARFITASEKSSGPPDPPTCVKSQTPAGYQQQSHDQTQRRLFDCAVRGDRSLRCCLSLAPVRLSLAPVRPLSRAVTPPSWQGNRSLRCGLSLAPIRITESTDTDLEISVLLGCLMVLIRSIGEHTDNRTRDKKNSMAILVVVDLARCC